MAATRHYFVINQEGKSANRNGPFESAQAAKDWVAKNYRFPCWILPIEYIGAMEHRPMDKNGRPIAREGDDA